MKNKNYENTSIIYFITIILFITEIIFIIIITTNKFYIYKNIQGIVVKDNILLIIMAKEDRSILNKNNYLYLNNKKQKFKIIETRKNVISKGTKKYSEILIKTKFDKKYKSNDIIQVELKDKKIKIIEIFRLLWEGG